MKYLIITNGPDEAAFQKAKLAAQGEPEALFIWSPSQLRGVRVWKYTIREAPYATWNPKIRELKAEIYARRRLGVRGLFLAETRDMELGDYE